MPKAKTRVQSTKYHTSNAKKNKGKFVKQAGIAKTNPKNNADALRITVGDKVKCKKQKCNAWHSEIHWHFLFSLYPIYFESRSMGKIDVNLFDGKRKMKRGYQGNETLHP
eukprot:764012_1